MKKLRILFPVLLAILMISWLGGELLAAEKIVELSVPKQRVNLDINDNGLDDLFQMGVALYEDGTVDGQGRLAGRIISFEAGRVSPGQFGTDYTFDILYAPLVSADPGFLTLQSNPRGEFSVILNLKNGGTHEFDLDPDIKYTLITTDTNGLD